ncbi:autophagy protein Atg27 [Tirmania nivea]|nr:autophagy protein Atg27 [Tirmania nivea]
MVHIYPLFWRSKSTVAPSVPASVSSALLLLLLPALASAADDCKLVADGVTFDLTPLKGSSSVTNSKNTPPTVRNMTWTINPCGPIEWPKEAKKEDVCPEGSHVCGIEWIHYDNGKSTDQIDLIIPIAGDLGDKDSTKLNPSCTRLKSSTAEADANKEGVRVELHGGVYPPEGGKKQKAVVEFICDKDKTGLEGQERDGKVIDGAKSLKYLAYEEDVLKLEWRTKQACEQQAGGSDGDGDEGSHWAFFKWFIIIMFLLVAAYLIFGSWLNYNRYDARGWDLLPHSDTLRDIPYLFKDFVRKVLDTVNGGRRRAGYSAV